jgi:hypothetical protein
VFKNVDLSSLGHAQPGWHKLGSNLARTIQEDIVNDTVGMPITNAALITLCETGRIISQDLKEAKPSPDAKPMLADLLKYDSLKELGGTEELSKIRGVLLGALKSQYPTLKQSDEYVIPLEALGRTLNVLKDDKAAGQKVIVVPNDDINEVASQPLLSGRAFPNYTEYEPSRYELVNYRSALASLAIPGWLEANRASIWPVDLDEHLQSEPAPKPKRRLTPEEEKAVEEARRVDEEAHKCVKGQSDIGVNMVILSAVNDNREQIYMYAIEDKKRGKMLVVGPDSISAAFDSELKKNGLQYVKKDTPATVAQIDEFLADGARKRGESGTSGPGAMNGVIESLIKAISSLCELTGANGAPAQPTVGKGSTMGKIIHDVSSVPALYTSILKQKM